MHAVAGVGLALLIFNGLRVIIGLPPISYWFRSRQCPACQGVGHILATKNGKQLVVTVHEEEVGA